MQQIDNKKMNKVTYKDEPLLFDEIEEFAIDSNRDHRRGSNFYRTDIIELLPEHKEYFPEVLDFEKYLGTWQTNQIIWDSEHGYDETFSELTRVKKVEVITHEWVLA